MDAHRGEVFSSLWRVTAARRFAADHLVEIDPGAVGDPRSTLTRWIDGGRRPAVIAGDGATVYAAELTGTAQVVASPLLAPIAGLMAGALAAAGGSVDPAGVQPIYVRRPDAEVAREALRQRANASRESAT